MKRPAIAITKLSTSVAPRPTLAGLTSPSIGLSIKKVPGANRSMKHIKLCIRRWTRKTRAIERSLFAKTPSSHSDRERVQFAWTDFEGMLIPDLKRAQAHRRMG